MSAEYSHNFTKADIKNERQNMWRYDAAYPIKYEELQATYQEGLTPLVKVAGEECNLHIKMESLMPTGSFKDRGTVMVVNYLLKQGVNKITEDSSGNAGASVAGYCALGNVPCEIYVPKGNSSGKLMQIKAYGAAVYEVAGSREDVAAAAQEHDSSYAGHNWHPLFVQGVKAIAYELWEQNGFKSPENIVAVAGNGSEIVGLYNGFKELLNNQQIDTMPRLFAAQPENCNPIYRAFVGDTSNKAFAPTIAEGAAIARPNKVQTVIAAVRETGGQVVSIGEDKITSAVKAMAGKGFYIEPTSALAYAAVQNLIAEGVLGKQNQVIMIVSGNGLKSGDMISALLGHK